MTKISLLPNRLLRSQMAAGDLLPGVDVSAGETKKVFLGDLLAELGVNRLINAAFRINQLAVSGTVVLAAGVYGHDMWKAGASGCTYTFATSGGVTTLTITAGSLIQVIEGANLQTGTHVLTWAGTVQGKIGAGSFAASGVTGAVTGGANLTIEFGTGTLSQVKLEPGDLGTVFSLPGMMQDDAACRRHYNRVLFLIDTLGPSQVTYALAPIGTPMRATPVVTWSPVSQVNVSAFSLSSPTTTGALGQLVSTAGGAGFWQGTAIFDCRL